MSFKNGLILCRNPKFSILDLPPNVNWVYGTAGNITTKYDYVANLNCHNYLVQEFLNDPSLYLNPNGTYLHLGGISDVLNQLDITLNSYYQRKPNVIQQISDYFKRLTKELGFSRWYISPKGKVLSLDVYYYEFQAHKEPDSKQSLDLLSDDYLYEIARQADYLSLMQLCQSNKRLNLLCSSERFKLLPVNAWIRQYSSPEEALIEAAGVGNLKIVNELIKMGVNPASQNNQAFINAVMNQRKAIVERLLQDNRISVGANKNQALYEAIHNGDLNMLKSILSNNFAAIPVNPSLLYHNPHLVVDALKGNHNDIIQWILEDKRFGMNKKDVDALREILQDLNTIN